MTTNKNIINLDFRKLLGQNILKLRKKYNLSQESFGKRIGVTAQSVSSYEKGNGSPTLDVAIEIAKTFDVSLDSLCGNEKETAIGLDQPITNELEALKTLMRLYDYYGSDMRLGTETVNVAQEYFDLNGISEPVLDEESNIEEREVFYIDSPYVSRYLSDFKKMKQLKEQGTIDEELFNNWANSRIEKVIKDIDKEKEEYEKRNSEILEKGELPF